MVFYGPLAQIAVGSTLSIIIGAKSLERRPVLINLILGLSVLLAMLLYSFFMAISPLQLPFLFYEIVFEDSVKRISILAFWIVNVLISIIFGVIVTMRGSSSTIHRKFFHLTVSMIYISGLFFDKDFTWLCGWLWFCIFVIIEVLRYFNVPPWGETLNNYLLVFQDGQDEDILFTPIFLLLGIFLPLFLSPYEEDPHLYHLAGVASVGVGDALAAVIGSLIGKHKWPGRKTTMEGSAAMCLGMVVFLAMAQPHCSGPLPSIFYCFLVSVVCTFVEAFVKNWDNLLLPLILYILL